LKELANPAVITRIKNIVQEFSPDILHAHMFHAEVVSAIAARFARAALIATRHSTGLEFEGARQWAVRVMRSQFDLLLAVSEEARLEAVRMGYPAERVVTLPNAVDTSRFHPLDDDGERLKRKRMILERFFPGETLEESLIVGSVGGLKPEKNLVMIQRIAARFLRERPDLASSLRFLIVGEGPQRERLTKLGEELGSSGIVAMPGGTGDTKYLYTILDIFVLPSLTEGVPMVLLEAMASGAACVATDVGGVGGVLGKAGKLVASNDEDALYQSVEMLLEDGNLRRKLGEKARRRAVEHYDINDWGVRIVEAYRSVLGEMPRA
jgi:glycosyltransferase involved in cell wall biosynthesis